LARVLIPPFDDRSDKNILSNDILVIEKPLTLVEE